MLIYPSLVPSLWLSLPVASYYLIPSKFLPGFLKSVYLPPPPSDSTLPLSCDFPPRSPYCLRIIQILVTILTTAPRLPVVYLCRSLLNEFLPLPELLPPRVSHISCPLAVTISYSRFFEENTCEFPLPSNPLPPKVPISQIQKVAPLVPPPCGTFPTPWFMTLPVSEFYPTYPIPALSA